MTGSVNVTVPEGHAETPPAVVVEVLAATGAEVSAGAVVARLALDKADVDVVAPVAGRVLSAVAVGAVLAAGATVVVLHPGSPSTPAAGAEGAGAAASTTRAEAVPAATRPEGPPASVPADGSWTEPLSRLRRTIARTMMTSLSTTAQRTTVVSVDVTHLMRLRERWNPVLKERVGVRLSPFHLLARAVCLTLPRHPLLNSWLDAHTEQVTFHAHVDLGIAVDTPSGLVVVTIDEADRHDVVGLAVAVRELAGRARLGRLTPSDVRRGTFTLSNTGSNGTAFGTPILTPPQVGLLATYAVEQRPVVRTQSDGTEMVAVRSMMNLALTSDHRVIDGAEAGGFLRDLAWVVAEHDVDSELAAVCG